VGVDALTRRAEARADLRTGRRQMILFYATIPIMVLALATATLPLLATIWREERARREVPATAGAGDLLDALADEEVPAAA
jgi:hypothetical protein